MNRNTRWLSLFLIFALILGSAVPAALASLDKPGRLKIMPAVIQVWWLFEGKDGMQGIGIGSGTLVSADGLILTNHHVAFPEPDQGVTHLGVALTVRSDRPPQPAYVATVVADDENLDLAVLRISHDLDLRPIRPAELNLPFVPLGDSDGLDVGDEINIFGYPGIGGDTVTFTRGVVSGFTRDAGIPGRAWVKTDTTIAGGNSGGTAVDEAGALVGVPTRAGAGGDAATVDCRPLADTDRNGRIDDADSCVPIGGFLNALRPANLARPLVEAARRGVAYGSRNDPAQPAPAAAATGEPRFYNVLFAPGVSDSEQPAAVVDRLPSGSRSLYVFFDYENMADGLPWEVRVSLNGKQQPDWGMPEDAWSGGASGNWWIGWSDAQFADGRYGFQFVVDGRPIAEAAIEIGGKAQSAPSFSDIVFSDKATGDGAPVEPGRLFPEGVRELYWSVDYANMARGNEWTRSWLLDGEVVSTKTEAWREGASGTLNSALTADDGLPAGAWRLELAIDGKPAARADFTIAGAEGGALFDPFVFSDDVDQETGKPRSTGERFPVGTKALYVLGAYRGMQDGLKSVSRVYLNGALVVESPFEWSNEFYGGANGVWWNVIHANGNELPEGEYTQELLVEGEVAQRGSARVGAGGKPAPALQPAAAANGAQVRGVITDADTGRPIPGAFFIVLNPGIKVAAFQWTEAEVYAMAETDRQGAFRLPRALEREQCYGLVIGAEGYWPHTEDDVCVGPNTPADTELALQLKRR
jgi:S1-C subfamily serine protease